MHKLPPEKQGTHGNADKNGDRFSLTIKIVFDVLMQSMGLCI